MKVKRMGITEVLRRIWLFSENKIKSSESGRKQPTQLIIELNSSLRHIIVTLGTFLISLKKLTEKNIHTATYRITNLEKLAEETLSLQKT
jgi:hypothetical protein